MKMLVPPGFTVAAVATARANASLPVPPEAVGSLTEIRHVMGVYARHFAGESRATRDPELLGELVARLEAVRGRLVAMQARAPVAMAPHVQDVSQQLALLTFEQQQLRQVAAGQAAEVRAGWLAGRTNEAIRWYRAHFEQRERMSRRAGLARRLARTFARIEAELAPDDPNRPFVASLLAHVHGEIDAILLAQAGPGRLDALGMAAQEEIDRFATEFVPRDRAGWDTRALGELCDRLVEIEWQLADLSEGEKLAAAVVTALDACELAWTEARASQAGLL